MDEISKQDAAQYLGISLRALERYTQQGRIGVKYIKGKRGRQARYQMS
ncbi:helix-turn-helix domain-containing protein [Crocosphaera sp. Alani8]